MLRNHRGHTSSSPSNFASGGKQGVNQGEQGCEKAGAFKDKD